MTDDVLLTTDPGLVVNQPGGDRMGLAGQRNEFNNPMPQSGGLSTFVNSEELRLTIDSVTNENRQLREQLLQLLSNCKPRIQQLESMKKINQDLRDQVLMCHEKSKNKILSMKNKVEELEQKNLKQTKEILILRSRQKGIATGPLDGEEEGNAPRPAAPVLEAVKGHMQEVLHILQEEMMSRSSRRVGDHQEIEVEQEDLDGGRGDGPLLERLMKHVTKAEEVLAALTAEMGSPRLGEGGSPVRRRATDSSPLSPGGQQEYNNSMENVLEQLQAMQQQEVRAKSALAEEREKVEALESRLGVVMTELNRLKGERESFVTAAVEKQRQEDDIKHQHEMVEMMARLDELTLLAADKHQRHALDEEPRYHSASNELKQQVTSLVGELKHKEKCLDEERANNQHLTQTIDDLQKKVKLYQTELAKAREDAQSYINTIHLEMKRKDTLYQSERQKGMHERLEHDKCKEDLANLQSKLQRVETDSMRFLDEKKVFQEKEDRYLAELLSAEEAIEAKELEKKRSEKEANALKGQIQIWKQQTSQCRSDFQEERKARELMHNEKLNLQAKVEDLMLETKKMEEELQNFHRQQLHQSRYRQPTQPAYGGGGVGYQRGVSELYGPKRQVYEIPGDDEAGTTEPAAMNPYPMEPEYFHRELRAPQQVSRGDQRNWCPKCQQTFPDFDTLNIHIAECIE